MNRDGRGKPGRIVLKNQPRLTLTNVLRRRRSTLSVLVGELGLTTYAGLSAWCRRMGVTVPTEGEFIIAFPNAGRVNSPREGVVVLEAPIVVAEPTGERIEPARPPEEDVAPVPEPEAPEQQPEAPLEAPEASQKKRRPKKDEPLPPVDKLS